MRKFVLDTLAFVLLQAAVFVVVWRACPRADDHYAAASIDKRERLRTAADPRIILVGGSSVSFGFDSRVLAAEGLYPVNMGHNVSLGLPFMLAQIEGQLRPGDVVVVAPEYPLLWGMGADEVLLTHLEHDPAQIRHVGIATARRLLDTGWIWFGRKLRCALHQVSTDAAVAYTRASFDECGDFVAHRGRPPRAHEVLPFLWPTHGMDLDPQIDRLNALYATCEARGARCVFAYPPIRASHLASGRDFVPVIEARLAERLRMPIILGPGTGVFPDHEFFDAGHHLTEDAARVHTRELVAALRRAGALP